MKHGLILEGGAMRGMFTAGVLDVLMEHHLSFDGAIGVSAGAVFGCNYKSGQSGRVIRYNTRFCRDPRYCSIRSLLKTGDLYGADFCYRQIPDELDPFDNDAYLHSPMEFYVTVTDMDTGRPLYHRCDTCDETDLRWMRASASMPLVSQPVEIDGFRLLDGGISDSIPIRYWESIGYQKNVVVLTQPLSYQKEKSHLLPLMRLALREYPHTLTTLENRHCMYNETTAYIRQKEQRGEVFVIRPPEALPIGRVSHNPEKLRTVYGIGRRAAEQALPALLAYLS